MRVDTHFVGGHMQLQVKKLTTTAKLPEKNYDTDAGIDLFADEDVAVAKPTHLVKPVLVKTGIAAKIPAGYCLVLKDRSGNAYKKGLHILAGVIDESYRGEIGVVMVNTGTALQEIKRGDKVAQALLLPVPKVEIQEVDNLDDTERGEKGFGSSG